MSTQYSTQGAAVQGVSIDNNRRLFNFGDRVHLLAPSDTPFFTYVSSMSKVPTDDAVFKMLEERDQTFRRTMKLKGAKTSTAHTNGTQQTNYAKFDSDIDIYGKKVTTPVVPKFVLNGQIVAMKDTAGTVRHFKVSDTPDLTADTSTAAELDLTPLFTATCAFDDNTKVEIIGSAFAEATGAPAGWKDELFDREGYTQIFKTVVPVFSGTSLATRYRGHADEYKRVWNKKIKEHKVDIEKAIMFGLGRSDEASSGPERHTHGIVTFTEANGQVFDMTYGGSIYDDFLDVSETFFAPESGIPNGERYVFASRSIITWLNKIGQSSFLGNTVGNAQYRMSIDNVKSKFGHVVTTVTTLWGTWHFMAHPFLRGPWEEYAIAVDMSNVSYRPLSANGVNRDTHVKLNIQANDSDSRQDQILTEAGLEVRLPETHAIFKFA